MELNQWLAVLLIVGWLGGGLAIALSMARSGHDLRLWLPLGILLGPFLGWFALERRRLDRKPGPQAKTWTRPGSFDALAAIDGSEESIAAVRAAVELLAPSLTSLTLTTVLDYEQSGSLTGLPSQYEAYAELVELAEELRFEPTEIQLLYGPPAETLAETAVRSGIELIIVGARGRGLSERLLGSVTVELVGTARVPVFVGSAPVVSTGAGSKKGQMSRPISEA